MFYLFTFTAGIPLTSFTKQGIHQIESRAAVCLVKIFQNLKQNTNLKYNRQIQWVSFNTNPVNINDLPVNSWRFKIPDFFLSIFYIFQLHLIQIPFMLFLWMRTDCYRFGRAYTMNEYWADLRITCLPLCALLTRMPGVHMFY